MPLFLRTFVHYKSYDVKLRTDGFGIHLRIRRREPKPGQLLTLDYRRPGWPSEGLCTKLGDAGFTPSFYLQEGNGSVSETFLNESYTALKTLPISPASGTPFLAVPRTKSHSGNELRLFFRRETDGQIAVFERSPDFTAAYDMDDEPALPFGTVGANRNIAGFTTARSAGTSDLNTVILLQDVPRGDITYTWTGDSSGWQDMATDSVFDGADVGGLSCLTAAATWDGYGVKPLEVSNHITNATSSWMAGSRKSSGTEVAGRISVSSNVNMRI